MEPLETLLERERAKDGIRLIRDKIPSCVDAIFARGSDMENLTVIDEQIQSQVRVNVLDAHELGHHRNTLLSIFADAPNHDLFSMTPALAEKIESLANREAASLCLSPDRLIDAYAEGCRQPYEFAETLGITEDAYMDGIRLQQSRYGPQQFFYHGYCLSFDPLVIRVTNKIPM